MPSSDDDTDPTSSQTTDASAARHVQAPSEPAPRSRANTARGLGEAAAAVKYRAPGDYSPEELAEMMDAFARAPRQFPPVETAHSNGLRAAAYAGEAPVMPAGVDTLPPHNPVIVSLRDETTQPPERRRRDDTTVELPLVPAGLGRPGVRIAIALVAGIVLVIGVWLLMRPDVRAADATPSTPAPADFSRRAPIATGSVSPSAPDVAAGSVAASPPSTDSSIAPSVASTPAPSTAPPLPRNPPRPVKPASPSRRPSLLPEEP